MRQFFEKKLQITLLDLDIFLLLFLIFVLLLHWSLTPLDVPPTLLSAIAWLTTIPVIVSGTRALLKRHVSIDVLAAVALIFALIDAQWVSALFINLMLTSARIFLEWNELRARRSLQLLLKLRPDKAKVRREGKIVTVPLAEVRVGDFVFVELGERIPIDGTVAEGAASVDTSALTGESLPISRGIGDGVLSSSSVLSGNLLVKAEKVGKGTTLEGIIQLIEHSHEQKPVISTIADRFAQWYIVAMFGVSAAVYLVTGNVNLTLSILLVVCADDLAIGIPLAYSTAVGFAARRGVIVKGTNYLEAMDRARILVVDKTGTLTKGKLSVHDATTFIPEAEAYKAAYLVSQRSPHPSAKAIMHFLGHQHANGPAPQQFEEVSGRGAVAMLDGHRYASGRLSFLRELGIGITKEENEKIKEAQTEGWSITFIAIDKKLVALFRIADQLKNDIAHTLFTLKNLGIKKAIMLTGDNEYVAARIAREAGITEYHANLLPADKIRYIEKNLGPEGKVIMVGDGVNDAASLARADIGIAMGRGQDVTIEAADIILMRDDFSKIAELIRLAKYVRTLVNQDIVLWAILNIIGLWLVFTGEIGPTGAAVYNFVTDFIPLLNSSRVFWLFLRQHPHPHLHEVIHLDSTPPPGTTLGPEPAHARVGRA